jgi:hypothetical protein
MQFFVWGSWLITIANYWFETKKWAGPDFGDVFGTLGFSSLIMPTIVGIIVPNDYTVFYILQEELFYVAYQW